jgi:RNA polymerase subunit RPABC4/transcription elongation factor Spt4
MLINPSTFSNWMLVLTGFAAAFVLALWVSLLIWTFRDIRDRARDPLIRILAVLVVAVLFLPGILIYLILRPHQTMEDEYQHTLEEEALLQTIEDNPLCPGCGRRIHENWIVCPNCHTKLKKPCHNCGKLMDLSWNLCPFCGTPEPGMRRESVSIDDALTDIQTILPAEEETPE